MEVLKLGKNQPEYRWQLPVDGAAVVKLAPPHTHGAKTRKWAGLREAAGASVAVLKLDTAADFYFRGRNTRRSKCKNAFGVSTA